MADWLTATCESELGTGDAPEWVHLVPSGRIVGRDGRNLVNDAAGVVIANFKAGGIDIPVDYEHQSERSNDGTKGPVPAAGWIKALEVRKDGIWGRVSWTAAARELIRNREYRFLSPALLYEKGSRRVVKLKSAALVHAPNLHLTALSSQEDNMEDETPLVARLVKLLGLEDPGDEEAIFDELKKRLEGSGNPDPAKFVPIEALQDLMQKHVADKAEMRQDRVTAKVHQAMEDGYLTPAMRPWALELCAANESAFDQFISSAVPQFAHLHRETHARWKPPSSANAQAASAMAEQVAGQLGIKAASLAD